MAERKSICVLALSPIARDGRVLRQIQYLAPHYDLTVAGYGEAPPAWADKPTVKWVQLPAEESWAQIKQKLGKQGGVRRLWNKGAFLLRRIPLRLALYAGRMAPAAYDWGYTLRWSFIRELQALSTQCHDAYLVNDWNALPLAAKLARQQHARLVVDLHEYAPLEFENRRDWWLYAPLIRTMLRRYATGADAVLTVAEPIAERYRQEFGLDVTVVLNAPAAAPLPPKPIDPQHVRIVHHGLAMAVRKPEVMIKTIALCEPRYTLHLMFIPSPYLQALKELADQVAPGRVFFLDPVPPQEIVAKIAEFDVGLNFIAPTNYNYLVCMPNKFFESLAAGLAICTGPSPAMASIVEQYKCGVVAPSFEPADLAAALNQTTAAEWSAMKAAAHKAAACLNADEEMKKVSAIFARLFAEK